MYIFSTIFIKKKWTKSFFLINFVADRYARNCFLDDFSFFASCEPFVKCPLNEEVAKTFCIAHSSAGFSGADGVLGHGQGLLS